MKISVELSKEEVRILDMKRGNVSKTAYIRNLIRNDNCSINESVNQKICMIEQMLYEIENNPRYVNYIRKELVELCKIV